jgi:hypothetical protein
MPSAGVSQATRGISRPRKPLRGRSFGPLVKTRAFRMTLGWGTVGQSLTSDAGEVKGEPGAVIQPGGIEREA